MLDALRRRDPNTGLNDDPEIVAFVQLITGTESLASRLRRYTYRGVDSLADALHDNGSIRSPRVWRLPRRLWCSVNSPS
jgi:hypothetical protein